ncbi:MAG: TolC family protein, partial [Parachlamydiaceae bacterium]
MLWLFLFGIFSLQAETVEDAVNLAFENNPNIFIPYYEIQENEGSYDLASLLPNPVREYAERWGPKGIGFGPKIDAGWLAPITDWLALPLDQTVAMDQVFKSWVKAYEASFNLMLDVENSYYKNVEKQFQFETIENLLELKKVVIELARAQYEQGNINNLFLLETEKAAAEIEKERGEFKEQLAEAIKTLTLFTGIPVKAVTPPSLYLSS